MLSGCSLFFPLLFVSFVFLQMCSSLKCGRNFSPQFQRFFNLRLLWWKALFLLPSYTRARKLIKDAFRDIKDVSKISVHSIRSKGATSAANAGIADRHFKRHGRWVSENAKDGYVKDDFNSHLSVTKSLGIWFILYCYLFIYFCFLNRARQVGRVLSTGSGFFLDFFRSERGEVFSFCDFIIMIS